ncbi:unnamed protein product [Miscanthus lutarioriparius]|uniref:Uncharacterized protein n=1 Tax=Miscanthus lutarioriparius TaxID=422564 RepID=A0A811RG33_9POAL|nr:unnamed protein product [Miscanthus lutarioriparius]
MQICRGRNLTCTARPQDLWPATPLWGVLSGFSKHICEVMTLLLLSLPIPRIMGIKVTVGLSNVQSASVEFHEREQMSEREPVFSSKFLMLQINIKVAIDLCKYATIKCTDLGQKIVCWEDLTEEL